MSKFVVISLIQILVLSVQIHIEIVRVIAVVQDPKDVIAIERMRGFKGLYHVLNGVLSPLDGMGPEDIGIPALIERLER